MWSPDGMCGIDVSDCREVVDDEGWGDGEKSDG